jgi:hypothetical protein
LCASPAKRAEPAYPAYRQAGGRQAFRFALIFLLLFFIKKKSKESRFKPEASGKESDTESSNQNESLTISIFEIATGKPTK